MKWLGIATGSAAVIVLGLVAYVVVVLMMVKPSGPAPESKACVCGHKWEQHDKGNQCKECSCQRFKVPTSED
jgi:hypothetical protein